MSVTGYGLSNEFREFIDSYIEDQLHNYAGSKVYMCDLGMLLTEEINFNRNYKNFSWQQAVDFAVEYIDDAADVFEYYKTELGMSPNFFENPNEYVVFMIIYGVENRLCESNTVDNQWNEEVELTEDIVKQILSDLDIGVD